MGVINTGSFSNALWPGQKKWFGEVYDTWPVEYLDLFDEESSTKAFEEITGISGFGLFSEKAEMAGILFDEASQAFVNRFNNKTYTSGYIVSLEAIEDNQYDISALGKTSAKGLAFAMRSTKETLAANVYNKAFNATYTYGDGVELCSLLHPLKAGGTFANELTISADLSEASLEQACLDVEGFTDDRGNKIKVIPQSLHIEKSNRFEAMRILDSIMQYDSANHNVNALKAAGFFPGGAKVNHYFTDADAWFIRNKIPAGTGMLYMNRVDKEFAPDNDFDTTNAKFRGRFRCSFGNADPRAVFGSPGA
jgi:hypothetical protein